MQVLARFFSYAFHPIFMPLLSLALCLEFDPYLYMFLPESARHSLYGILVVNTILIPISTLIYFKRKKVISSYELNEQNERNLPYVMTFVYYLLTYVVLRRTGLPGTIFSILFCGVTAVSLLAIVNFYWKISAHAIGVGGLVGALCGLAILNSNYNYLLLVIVWLVAGLVASSRLILKAHTPAQVYVGFLSVFSLSVILVSNNIYM